MSCSKLGLFASEVLIISAVAINTSAALLLELEAANAAAPKNMLKVRQHPKDKTFICSNKLLSPMIYQNAG